MMKNKQQANNASTTLKSDTTLPFSRLALHSAMAMALFGGYGRAAYANCAVPAGSTQIVCEGAATTTQTLNDTTPNAGGLLPIVTGTGFSIDTSGTYINAIDINTNGTNGISFTQSPTLLGDITGGRDGINASNNGAGALSITTTGAVIGISRDGIVAYNLDADSTGGISISASEVTGAQYGIFAINYGTGTLNITTTGAVSGGIFARNLNADGTGDINISATSVTGDSNGISAKNYGTGTLNITTTGAVSGDIDTGISTSSSGTTTVNIDAGSVSGNQAITLNGTGTSTVNLAAGTSLTGTGGVALTNNGTGALTLNSAGAITGDINLGTSDDTVNITGGSLDGQVVGSGTGNVNIDVGTGNTFVSNGIVNVLDYTIVSGRVEQLGNFSTAGTTTTIENGATLAFSNAVNGSGAFISNGNIEFNLSSGNLASLIQNGDVTLNNGSTVTVNIDNSLPPELGDTFNLITATGTLNNNGTTVLVLENNFLLDFVPEFDGTNFSISTSAADLSQISNLDNTSNFGGALTSFFAAGGDNAVIRLLEDLTADDIRGFEQIADTFSPSVSGALLQGSLESFDTSRRLIESRFVGATSGHSQADDNGLWLDVYGGVSDQDSEDSVEGYDADTQGVAIGYDRKQGNFRVGLAFNYTNTDADNDRFAQDEIEIDSNQFIVYGGYEHKNWIVNAVASYTDLDYELERNNLIAGSGDIEGDTDGDLISFSSLVGYRYQFRGVSLSPTLGLRYSHLDIDSYQESGGLNLAVDYDDIDNLVSELSLTVTKQITTKSNWQINTSGRIGWSHEYLQEEESLRASFGTNTFTQEGFERDEDFINANISVEFSNQQGISISLDYVGEVGSNFDSHRANMAVRYAF
jgi:outer membrane autotransporter protein